MKAENISKEQLMIQLEKLQRRLVKLEKLKDGWKQTEQALRESENRFRSIVENSHDGILIVDNDFKFTYVNDVLCQMLGRSSKEILKHDFREFLDDESKELVADRYIRRQQGEKVPSVYEFNILRKDGQKRRVEIKSTVIKDSQGKVITISQILDITESKKAEENLNFLSSAVEQSSEGMAIADLGGHLLFVNHAWAKMHGYQSGDVVVDKHLKVFHNREQLENDVYPFNQKVLEHGFYSGEVGHIRKDGTPFPTLMTTTLLKNKDGEPIALVGIAKDITEYKKDQEKIFRLASVLEQASEIVMITDLKGNIEYVNPAFEKITGYTATEVMGKNPRILKSGAQERVIYKELWKTITSGKTWHGEFVNRRKNATTYTEDAVIFPVKNSSGKIINYAAVKRDITQQKKMEEEFRQAQKMEAVGRLAGGVAHDFNNLLTVIKGYSDLILHKIKSTDPFYKDIEQIHKAGEKATSLVGQLLAFSRRQVIQPKVLNLNDIVTNIDKMLRRVIGEDIVFSTELSPNLGNIKIDPGQLEQVILNIAVNARDALPGGGEITIETANVELDKFYTQQHRVVLPGPYVMLAISDSGVGMDKKTQSHLFEPFFTTKEQGKGTGLGLSTVYGIVKQNRGYIWVYSEKGKGTTFKIYLPRVQEAIESLKVSEISVKSLHGTETILLTEDDTEVRNFARRVLEENGYTILEASGGSEAIHFCKKQKSQIHLLLTDVVMPGMSGKTLVERIKRLYPKMKIIFISGYTDNAIVHQRILEPGVTLIQKPFSPRQLLEKIRYKLDE